MSAIDITKFLQFGNTAIDYDGAAALYSGQLEQNKDLYTPKYHKRVTLWNAFDSPNFASNSNAPSLLLPAAPKRHGAAASQPRRASSGLGTFI